MRIPFTFLFFLPAALPRYIHSLPEDPYAFPKFKVAFLNNLPISNETAQRWLDDGLKGGQRQFLEQPWKESEITTPVSLRKEIEGSGSQSVYPFLSVWRTINLFRASRCCPRTHPLIIFLNI